MLRNRATARLSNKALVSAQENEQITPDDDLQSGFCQTESSWKIALHR
jgi:hypothetical protein